ncbi:MAG: GlcG/HbpS family heme-binding protein [Acidobacteriota bacterium]
MSRLSLVLALCILVAAPTLAQDFTLQVSKLYEFLKRRSSLPGRQTLEQATDFDPGSLTSAQVDAVVSAAVTALDSNTYSVVVVDRAGNVLAVWQKPEATLEIAERALSLARTGAFFSNNQAPLSSRTVRFISQIHFPPGIPFQPNGALYGIENTNRGCSFNTEFNTGKFVPRARSLAAFLREEGLAQGPELPCDAFDQSGCGPGVSTGKFSGRLENGRLIEIPEEELFDLKPEQVHGGGIPLFKDCQVVGGIGVFGVPPDHAEYAALAGSLSGGPGFGPLPCVPPPGAVFLDGVRLPFVRQTTQPAGTSAGVIAGGYLVAPREGSTMPAGWLVGGPENPGSSPELSAEEVQRIVEQSIAQADRTRAAIRLPLGSRARMAIAVSDLEGNLLALYRMADATVFSIDVAVAKSRNVVYFSSQRLHPQDLPEVPPGTAVTNRTISFGAQPFYPPGIDGTAPGPFFDLYLRDFANPCSQGLDDQNPANINSVVFFPGSAPLYRDRELIGGLGISGDGVEQDDVVAAAGSEGFEATPSIRADQIFIRGVRLPYFKFNRNPEQ